MFSKLTKCLQFLDTTLMPILYNVEIDASTYKAFMSLVMNLVSIRRRRYILF